MDEKLKQLYDKLVQDGYELPDYNSFTQKMGSRPDAEKLYTVLVKDGYEIPSSFDDFYRVITPKQSATVAEYTGAGIGGFNRGISQIVSAPLKFIGAGGNFLQSLVEGEDVNTNSDIFTQAGQAVQDFTERINPRYENVNQTFQSVTEGLGQAAGMISTAGLGAAARTGQLAEAVAMPTGLLGATGQGLKQLGKQAVGATGFVGGSMTAVPEWEAAKAAGLSDEDAFEVLLKNYVVGQTEAIPIQRLLGRQGFLGRLNRVTKNSIANLVKNSGIQGLEEAIQEGIQTYLTNEIAKNNYDPDRDPLFQVLESAKVGGIVGLILPGVTSLAKSLPAEKKVKLERKIVELQVDETINEVGDTGDPALNAEIDAVADIDPVDKQVLEEVKIAEAVQEEQKEVETQEKLDIAIRESQNKKTEDSELGNKTPNAENKSEKSGEKTEKRQYASETPEYKAAVVELDQLQKEFAALPINATQEESFELYTKYVNARRNLQKIAGEAKDTRPKTDIQKQIEDTTGVTKPEKSVKMTPNEAIKHQVQTFYKGVQEGVYRGKDASNELINKVQEAIKESPLSVKQVSTILTKVRNTNLFTPGSVSKLNSFVDKVTTDAEFADKLSTGRSLRKLIQSKKSSDSRSFKEKKFLKLFTKIKPDEVSNIDEYNDLASSISTGLKSTFNIEDSDKKLRNIVTGIYKNELQVTPPSSASTEDLINSINEKKELDRETNELQKVAYDLNTDIDDVRNMSEDQMTDAAKKEKLRQSYIQIAKSKKIEVDVSDLSSLQKQDVKEINSIDTSMLTTVQLKDYIRIVDRINENSDFGYSGKIAAIGKAQESWKELIKLNPKTLNLTWLEAFMDSQPMAIEAIFGLPEDAAKFQLYMAIKGMNDGSAISVREGENFAQMLDRLKQDTKLADGFSDESLFRQGIYQELIRKPESMEDSEAVRVNKELIIKSIERKKLNGFSKEAKTDERFFNPFKNASTIQEIKDIMQSIDPAGKKIVDAMIDYHQNYKLKETDGTFLDLIKSDNERFENKDIEVIENYGAPRAWKKIGRGAKVDFDDITEFNPAIAKLPKPKQIKSGMSLTMKDRDGAVLDFNVHKNAVDNIQKSILRAYIKPYQYQLREMLKNQDGLEKLFGMDRGKDESIKRTNNLIDALFNEQTGIVFNFEKDLVNNGRPDSNQFVRTFAEVLRALKKTGYSITLSGYTQAPKQATVLTNVAIQLGSDAELVAKAISQKNEKGYTDFFRGQTVDTRGEQSALLNVGEFYNASDRLEAETKLDKLLGKISSRSENRFRKSWGGVGVLTSTDVSVSKTSFLAFYMKYLKDNKAEFMGLEEEYNLRNDKLRQEALAFAKQRVDTLQVVSNPAEQSKFFKEKGLLPEVARAFFVPYGGFSSSTKVRLFNDYKALLTGNSKQKAKARKDIIATFVEQASFNVVSQGLKLAMYGSIGLLLRGAFDLEDEEDWETWWQKTKREVAKNMLFSNLPAILGEPGENMTVDAINYAYFNFLQQQDPDLTEKEYEKEHAPITRYKNYQANSWDYFGPYGGSLGKIADVFELADQGASNENLTENQKNLAFTAALIQAGQLRGLVPADISNAVRAEFNKQKKMDSSVGQENMKIRPQRSFIPQKKARLRRRRPARILN